MQISGMKLRHTRLFVPTSLADHVLAGMAMSSARTAIAISAGATIRGGSKSRGSVSGRDSARSALRELTASAIATTILNATAIRVMLEAGTFAAIRHGG